MVTMCRLLALLSLLVSGSGVSAIAAAARIVVVVWDGMRPDFVNSRYTPTLARLARQGVTFANHHSVYVSSTEVNGAVFATGVYPGLNGIIGNKEYRPGINLLNPVMTADEAVVRRGDSITAGHFLPVPTLAEILHVQGLRTAIAGSKPVALLQDRCVDEPTLELGAVLFEGHLLPASLAPRLEDVLGSFPPVALPKIQRDGWTTSALLGPLWSEGVPPFSLLWLSEPDYSQHGTGPGSRESLAAVKSSDANLARVVEALKRRRLLPDTDLLVVSDHAFSTISQKIDLVAELKRGGFQACRDFDAAGPRPGQVMVIGNGGTALFYVIGHEATLVEQLAHFLQAQPFAGVLFTRIPVAGAFSLAQGHINSPAAPDIVLSLRWSPASNHNGAPGLLVTDISEYGPGQGMHASLSPFDLHNTCIAVGPDFRHGYRDLEPTGNIDLVPTILELLGLPRSTSFSGRVLTEALAKSGAAPAAVQHHHLEANWKNGPLLWHQYLDCSEVNGVTYFDSGNGRQTYSTR